MAPTCARFLPYIAVPALTGLLVDASRLLRHDRTELRRGYLAPASGSVPFTTGVILSKREAEKILHETGQNAGWDSSCGYNTTQAEQRTLTVST
jgi:hypothetical protein